MDDSQIGYYVSATEQRPPGPPSDPDDVGVGSTEPEPIDHADKDRDDGPGDPQVLVAMET